jgi:hypothetical protein
MFAADKPFDLLPCKRVIVVEPGDDGDKVVAACRHWEATSLSSSTRKTTFWVEFDNKRGFPFPYTDESDLCRDISKYTGAKRE